MRPTISRATKLFAGSAFIIAAAMIFAGFAAPFDPSFADLPFGLFTFGTAALAFSTFLFLSPFLFSRFPFLMMGRVAGFFAALTAIFSGAIFALPSFFAQATLGHGVSAIIAMMFGALIFGEFFTFATIAFFQFFRPMFFNSFFGEKFDARKEEAAFAATK